MTVIKTQTYAERILSFVRKLLGLQKDLEKIVSPLTKIADEIDALVIRERDLANREVEAAASLLAKSEARKVKVSKAQAAQAALPTFTAAAQVAAE